jgi:hypothetical protein
MAMPCVFSKTLLWAELFVFMPTRTTFIALIIAVIGVLALGSLIATPSPRPAEETIASETSTSTSVVSTSDETATPVVAAPQTAPAQSSGIATATAPAATVASSSTLASDAQILIEGKTFAVISGRTVFDEMRRLKGAGALIFESAAYPSLGAFAESINGKKNAGGFYWFLYLNGKTSEMGMSNLRIRPGDLIEWRYKDSYSQ